MIIFKYCGKQEVEKELYNLETNINLNNKITTKMNKKLFSFGLIFLIIFVSAGLFGFLWWLSKDLYWYDAWIVTGLYLIIGIASLILLMIFSPELLYEKFKHQKEKDVKQAVIVQFLKLLILLEIIIAGLDHRYTWSIVPFWFRMSSWIIFLTGVVFLAFVFKENSHLYTVIKVDKKQKVISSGPYAMIRHPYYFGVILLLFLFSSGLGSFWAMLPMCAVIIMLIVRTNLEDAMLQKELKGYKSYSKKVKWKLLPGIW